MKPILRVVGMPKTSTPCRVLPTDKVASGSNGASLYKKNKLRATNVRSNPLMNLVLAEFHANILTIHQSIPINGIASLTLSVDVLPQTGVVAEMLEHIEEQEGIHYVKILARE